MKPSTAPDATPAPTTAPAAPPAPGAPVASGEATLLQMAGNFERDPGLASAPPQLTPEQEAQIKAGEQAMQKLVTALTRIATGGLAIVRARIARKVPEIRDHWDDATLKEVGDAAGAVAIKYVGKLGPALAAYPEECMLLLATVPLASGYFDAVSEHAEKEARTIEAGPPPAPRPAAPARAPAPTETPVHHVGG